MAAVLPCHTVPALCGCRGAQRIYGCPAEYGSDRVLLVLVLVSFMVARLITVSSRLMPAVLVLIVHATVDFDWSFGLVWVLLLWLTVMGFATTPSGQEVQNGPHTTQRHKRFKIGRKRLAVYKTKREYPPLQSLSLLRVTAIILLAGWVLLGWRAGHQRGQERRAASEPPGAQTALLQSSLKWNPANTEAALCLADWLPQASESRC